MATRKLNVITWIACIVCLDGVPEVLPTYKVYRTRWLVVWSNTIERLFRHLSPGLQSPYNQRKAVFQARCLDQGHNPCPGDKMKKPGSKGIKSLVPIHGQPPSSAVDSSAVNGSLRTEERTRTARLPECVSFSSQELRGSALGSQEKRKGIHGK